MQVGSLGGGVVVSCACYEDNHSQILYTYVVFNDNV